mmetsp:Transcript_84611/g.236099  ORF Transcript_84611/g.236099 Transcript_84611/m.236099 type:complete len:95 (+) Transcript_84611:57-341(+)
MSQKFCPTFNNLIFVTASLSRAGASQRRCNKGGPSKSHYSRMLGGVASAIVLGAKVGVCFARRPALPISQKEAMLISFPQSQRASLRGGAGNLK